jgi:hypothetical protein
LRTQNDQRGNGSDEHDREQDSLTRARALLLARVSLK